MPVARSCWLLAVASGHAFAIVARVDMLCVSRQANASFHNFATHFQATYVARRLCSQLTARRSHCMALVQLSEQLKAHIALSVLCCVCRSKDNHVRICCRHRCSPGWLCHCLRCPIRLQWRTTHTYCCCIKHNVHERRRHVSLLMC
jgi:hypothetical protein